LTKKVDQRGENAGGIAENKSDVARRAEEKSNSRKYTKVYDQSGFHFSGHKH